MWELWCVVRVGVGTREDPKWGVEWDAFTAAFHVQHPAFRESEDSSDVLMSLLHIRDVLNTPPAERSKVWG